MTPVSISTNLERVQKAIRRASERVGRAPEDVLLVAVSKTVDVAGIHEAIAAGMGAFGENRVQEAKRKIAAITQPVSWHFIGSLQTNKVKDAVRLFDWIHSLDRLELAKELDRRASAIGKTMNTLIEIHMGENSAKTGIPPEELKTFLAAVADLKKIHIGGLMTIPPIAQDPEESRPHFQRLREIRDSLGLEHLSMGMSRDFEVAVEEGATMVRVGTAIFGPRVKQ